MIPLLPQPPRHHKSNTAVGRARHAAQTPRQGTSQTPRQGTSQRPRTQPLSHSQTATLTPRTPRTHLEATRLTASSNQKDLGGTLTLPKISQTSKWSYRRSSCFLDDTSPTAPLEVTSSIEAFEHRMEALALTVGPTNGQPRKSSMDEKQPPRAAGKEDLTILQVLFRSRLCQGTTVVSHLSALPKPQLDSRLRAVRKQFQSLFGSTLNVEEFRTLLSLLLDKNLHDVDVKESTMIFELIESYKLGQNHEGLNYEEFLEGLGMLMETSSHTAMFRWVITVLERPFPNKLISCYEITLVTSAILNYFQHSSEVKSILDKKFWPNLKFWNDGQLPAPLFRKIVLDDPDLRRLFHSLPKTIKGQVTTKAETTPGTKELDSRLFAPIESTILKGSQKKKNASRPDIPATAAKSVALPACVSEEDVDMVGKMQQSSNNPTDPKDLRFQADLFFNTDWKRQVEAQEHGNPQFFVSAGSVWCRKQGEDAPRLVH